MSDASEQTRVDVIADVVADTIEDLGSEEGRNARYWIFLGIGAPIVACLLLFAVAMVFGTVSGRFGNVAAIVAIIRDVMVIFLLMQAISIGIALIAMLVQLYALINLLQNEIQPILESTRQASKTVTGTADFISKRVAEPVFRAYAVLSGARIFFREIAAIQRNVSPRPSPNGHVPSTATEGVTDESTPE